MEKKSEKLKNFNILDEKINELESTLSVISSNLYGEKNLNEEQLSELISKLKGLEEVSSYVEGAVSTNLTAQKKLAKKSKFIFGAAFLSVIVFALSTGLLLPAAICAFFQILLASNFEKDYKEVDEYLKKISNRSAVASAKLDNYQTSAKVKMRMKNQDFEELTDTDKKIANFSIAESTVQSLLQGNPVGKLDENVAALVKEMLKDGGAEGETIEELTTSMQNKIESQKGGKTFNKK